MLGNSAAITAAWASRLSGWALPVISVLVGHALILVRAANVAAPLYGGDEIAYWHNARALFAGVKAATFNEYLQQVNCDLFFLMVGWLAQRPDGALAMRLLNYMMLMLTASLVYGAARRVTSRAWAAVAATLVFITGPSVWLVSTMPETAYAFFFAILAFVIARFWTPGAASKSFLVGVLAGMLMLIKSHGIAVALACIATSIAAPLLIHRNARALRVGAIDLLLLVAGIVLSVVTVASLARGELVLTPSRLIGSFYVDTLSGTNLRSLSRLIDIARYYLAHMVVLAMLFSPALIFAVRIIAISLTASGSINAHQRRLLVLVIFVAFCAAAVFAMVAVFSETVGLGNEFERYRLHGRYWTFLTPWLATIAFSSINAAKGDLQTAWTDRAVGLLGLAATLLFVLVISKRFSLYPWDFPELFGFYRPELQKWKMQLLWLPHAFAISLVVMLLGSILWLYGFRYRAMAYAATLVTVFIVGNINTTQWQIEAADGFLPRVASGLAARRMVGEHAEGVLIGASYYGQGLFFVLYNLPLHSHVIQKPEGSALSEADLPAQTQWVITTMPYDIRFNYRHVIPLPAATLYLRDELKAR